MAVPSPEAQAALDMFGKAREASSPSDVGSPPEDIVASSRAMVASWTKLQGPSQSLHSVEDHTFRGSDGPLTIRLYRPAEGTLPVLLFFYGGGFISGTIDTYDTVLRTVAHKTGWAVAAPQYRLAPEYPYPAATEDCYAALVHLASRASSLGIDARRIAVTGESAGGTLAAVVALITRDRHGPPLAGMVCLEPVCDSRAYTGERGARDIYPSLTENDGMVLSWENMIKIIDLYIPSSQDRLQPYASPGLAPDLTGLPPSLILTAECDPLRDDGNAFAERLRTAGVSVESVCLKGAIHGVLAMMNLMPEVGGKMLLHLEQFLRRLD